MSILKRLEAKSFSEIKNRLYAFLNDQDPFPEVSSVLFRKDGQRYGQTMTAWLDDPTKRKIALKSSYLLLKNTTYTTKALPFCSLDGAEAGMIRFYLPLILFTRGEQGTQTVREFLQKERGPEASLRGNFLCGYEQCNGERRDVQLRGQEDRPELA